MVTGVSRWRRQSVEAVRADESAEQGYCPHGNDDCTGPNGPGLSCFECFAGGGE